MIKNIIFDLGGVILKNNPSSVMESLGIDDNDFDVVYDNFFHNLYLLDTGAISLKEYFNNCDLPLMLKRKYEKILCHYYEFREFDKDVISLIDKLKENKYNIYFLSNNNKETYEFLFNQKILNGIDGWIISCEYHICKPEPELFDILLKKYRLNPKECYYIDDSELNINVAKRKGINGIVFKDIESLLNDMKQNDINLK